MQEFDSLSAQPKSNMPFPWPNKLKLAQLMPASRRSLSGGGRRRTRGKSSSGSSHRYPESITKLQTSPNMLQTVRLLQRRKWSLYDIQYMVLLGVAIFSLSITPAPVLVKLGAIAAASLVLLMPITRQFFMPSLSIWVWLLYFFTSRYIPAEYRPHIWVRVLPALENVLYGANLSNILSAHKHAALDLLAWFPYGIVHFSGPLFCCLAMFFLCAPGTTPVFARAFGWMNLLGVTIQLVFPCTPPWYENLHGLEPAHYGMEGSPAGLARIDELFGVDMYTTSFTTAPVPFGAFPSLHAGNATLEALFMSFCFPKLRPFFIMYVGWIWWATMYLSHHYAVDLVGGSLIAAVFYYVARARWLPRQQPDKANRWQYECVEVGQKEKASDEEFGTRRTGYSLGFLERRGTGDSDEWTIGSASSSSFGSRSSLSGSGSLSPVTPHDEFGKHLLSGRPSHDTWDEYPEGQADLQEVVVVR